MQMIGINLFVFDQKENKNTASYLSAKKLEKQLNFFKIVNST